MSAGGNGGDIAGDLGGLSVGVVGGGFAGDYCAARLAEAGVPVTVYDAKQAPGTPSNTTGGIAWHWIHTFVPDLPRNCINAEINTVRIVGPGGVEGVISGDNPLLRDRMGVVLDEPRTLAWLEARVRAAGGDVRRPVRIESLHEVDGYDHVILADGWTSRLGRELGLTMPMADEDHHVGVELIVPASGQRADEIMIYFGRRIAPQGYMWDFPTEHGQLRKVGLGISMREQRRHAAIEYLREQAALRGWDFARTVSQDGGVIPTSRPVREHRRGKYHIVGDAARWCDPMTGGGIFPAWASAAACVEEILGRPADLSWLQKEMQLRYRLKRLLYVLSDASLDRLVRKLDLTLRTPGPLNPIAERKRVMWRVLLPMIPSLLADYLVGEYDVAWPLD